MTHPWVCLLALVYTCTCRARHLSKSAMVVDVFLLSPLSWLLICSQVNQQADPDAPKVAQPDNAEQRLKLLDKKEESCLALATNLWQSDTVWNDIACYHQKEWICEDSDQMLKEAGLA